MNGVIYEIQSVRHPRVKTKLLIFGEAKDTILNLIIGENVQTYIKIKTGDLVKVLEEMGIVERKEQKEATVPIEIVSLIGE